MYFQKFARLSASLGVLLILTTTSYPISLFVPNNPYSYFSGPHQNTAGSLRALPAIPGLYELSFNVFQGGVLVPVGSLPVLSQEMILAAHVEDTNGNPAQAGTVTFEYCSYNGLPPNDIDRADEAPKEACDAGLATWDRLGRASIGSCLGHQLPGVACVFFGVVRIPRDVGFRYKFAGPRHGGVDSGMSDELNFTWTPAPTPTPTPTPTPAPTPTPTPIPDPGVRTNFALASNGGFASASSEYSGGFPASGANNGDRKGLNWESGGGWNDSTAGSYPDWLQIDFNGTTAIDEINVFTVQDNYAGPSEPDENMIFTLYGNTDFEIQYWDGAGWMTVPGGGIANTNKIWTKATFPAISTTKIRVHITNSLASYSRLAEVEAWGST